MIVTYNSIKSGCRSFLKRMASLFLFIALFPVAKGQVITVKQDGTGDFTVIQEAVEASSNGDTVLVFPGIYFENIDLTNKYIVLTSCWIISYADSLIRQTIIDGNHSGSCIISLSGDSWTTVIGLTIQNGFGTNLNSIRPWFYGNGGGIMIGNSKMKVLKCWIENNFGYHGAGIFSGGSSLELSGNTICNNWAQRMGGGIAVASSVVSMDSVDLNNIYLNYSCSGSDIAIFYNDTPTKIWLDTATVLNPDQYYIGKFNNYGIHIERPIISVLHGKIEQVNADLFVSPDGDNNNSGLTVDRPLKTISFALLKISSDSLEYKSVHVENGIYSCTSTGEHTPLQLKNFVNIVGERTENTIVDCENEYEGARFAFGQDYAFIKNITFQNGNGYFTGLDGGISTGYSRMLVLDSIAIETVTGDYCTCLYSDSDDTLIIKNSFIKQCAGMNTVELFVNNNQSSRYFEFISCRFSGNHPDSSQEGRQVCLSLTGLANMTGSVKGKIINSLFNDNTDSLHWSGQGGSVCIYAMDGCILDIINSTFANNLTLNNPGGGAIGVMDRSLINFYNCVLYGNYGCQAYLDDFENNDPDTIRVNYSLVQDGQNGIKYYGSDNDRLIWGDGNLDQDPVFFGTGEFPYAIDAGSPCIDAGTLALPPGITLPEYDLAGNPRVYGESVDMGAYEYGPWVSIKEIPNSEFRIPDSGSLKVSPNPFSYGTYVSYEMKAAGRLNISVYSISGMKVKSLINYTGSAGDKGSFYWDGKDQNGQTLPSGAYILRMTLDDQVVEVVKVVRK